MNQPERRYPLTGSSAVPEFIAALERIEVDATVRCVILTAKGPVFSAGGDIREMQRQSSSEVSEMHIRSEYRRGIQQLPLKLFNLEVPVIAAVNRPALGAGLDLACMCDIRIASERAKFGESFVKLGIVAGDGGAWLLPRIVGLSRASEMAFTGDTIDAYQALASNLVSRVVPAAELMQSAHELTKRIAANPNHGLRLTKRLIREGLHSRLDTVLEMAASFQAITHKTPDHREAVASFLEKRAPCFDNQSEA